MAGAMVDRIAGVDAHRVEIFNRTDHDEIVRPVAHHFEFVLLPTEHRLFDEHLGDRRGAQAAIRNLTQLRLIVCHAAAAAAEGERRAHQHWIPDPRCHVQRLIDGRDRFAQRHAQPGVDHGAF
jgi:hypothetical protein